MLLWEKVYESVEPDGECLHWVGLYKNTVPIVFLDAEDRERLGQEAMSAMRAVWYLETGEMPEARLYRECRNLSCVKFEHLTYTRPTIGCKYGHPEERMYTSPKGKRYCRDCNSRSARRYASRVKDGQ